MRTDRWRRLAAVALALGVAACSSGSGSDDASTAAGDVPEAVEAVDAAGGGDAVTAGLGRPEGKVQAADVEASTVYTGSLVVRVEDRRQAASEAAALSEAHGGRLFDQRIDLEGEGDAVLTLKVAPDEFDAAMAALADLGRPLRNEVGSEDVTDQVVDLEGRLDTAERSATRLRDLLTSAADVNAIVAVEQELAKREAEIESIQGQLRVFEARTALATITVTLTERDRAEPNKDIPGFGSGLSRGLVAAADAGSVGLTGLGFALPFLAVAVPLALAWRLWRRRRTTTPRPTTEPLSR